MIAARRLMALGLVSYSCFALSASVRASLLPLGPFVGDLSEDFESFPLPAFEDDYLPNPLNIMSGAASLQNSYLMTYASDGSWGLGTSGNAGVANGNKGLGVSYFAPTTTEIIFEQAVAVFGAYWGAFTGLGESDPALIGVAFFDSDDVQFDSQIISYSRPGDGVLEWHGWISTTPIKRITYVDYGVVIDGLQANLVPEPAAAMLLVLGAITLRARRRRAQKSAATGFPSG